MKSFLAKIKKIVEILPDYTEGDFEVRNNKGFETLYFCDIAVIRVLHLKNENRLEFAEKYFRLFGLSKTDQSVSWIRVTYDDQIADKVYNGTKEVFKKCYKDSAEYTFDVAVGL